MAISTSSGSADYELFDELAEEFAERYRRGERPSLQEYIDRCPAMGDDIREMFPALVEVEQAEEVLDAHAGPAALPSAPALRQVGDYRVIREAGRGGMGVVYEADQVSLGRRVALKVLPGGIAKDRKALERFRREARAAARLHHTNIVPVFEVGQDGDVVFYAMQFIQGQGLDVVIDELARQRPKSGHGSAAAVPAGAEEEGHSPVGATRPERAGAVLRSLAALPVRDRSEALAASLRARQVSRVARSLVTGSFAAKAIDPDRTDSSNGVAAAGAGDGPANGLSARSSTGLESSISSASASAVLPGGTQVSAVESSGRRLPFFRSVAQIGRQAAQGLAYAHARGIIHRDIKPSNLLLDTAGVVWITDFGLAKSDDGGLTATGDILGTIRYMAPERFRGEGDIRADVYALGLTLYELLTLRPGFETSDRLRMIERIKTEDPVRPRVVDSRIPRDLETIVLKAIDKDPDRRYPTAEAMAEDLRRYLDDEPVLARRTMALERYARWARHNPGVAVLGAVLTAVLLLVTVGSLIVAGRMSRLAGEEVKAARDAELARHQEADQRALAEKAQHQAEVNAKEADAQRKQAEANFAKARAAVDDSFTKISESQLLTVPGMQPLRRELLSSALGFYEDFVKEHGDDPTVRAGLAFAFLRVGKIRGELGESQAATESFEKARALFDALVQANPAEPELSHGLAESLYRLGRYDEAITIWQHLVVPGQTRFQRELADAYNGAAYSGNPDPITQLDLFQKSLSIREMLVTLNPDDPIARRDLGGSLHNIGVLLRRMGQPEQALALYRRALEQGEKAFAQAPHEWQIGEFVSDSLYNCAKIEDELGRLDESLKWYRRLVEFCQTIARDNPSIPSLQYHVVGAYGSLILVLRERGLHNEAMETIPQAREWIERLPRHGAEALFDLACARATCSTWFSGTVPFQATEERDGQVNEADLAMDALRQAVAAGFVDLDRLDKEPQLLPLRSRTDFKALVSKLRSTTSQSTSADVTKGKPTPSTARPQERSPAGPVRSAQSQENQAAARHAIGLTLLHLGKLDAAAKHLEQALAVRQQLVAEEPARLDYQFELAATMVGLAEHDRKAGCAERARQLWRKALPMLTQSVERRPTDRLAWQLLGLAHAGLGQPDQAATAFANLMELVPPTNYAGLWWYPDPATIGEFLAPYDEIFARVVQMRPTDRTLLIARFHYFGRRRRWREAADIVTRIIELDPDDFHAQGYHRILLYHCGDFDGYQRELRRGLISVSGAIPFDETPSESPNLLALPRGAGRLAVESYRNGRYTEAIRHCKELIETTNHRYFLTETHLLLAMAHQKLGQSAEARKELEVARKLLSSLGRDAGYGFVYGESELMNYGWTEWLYARIVLNEAEALILYDPIFPADPFAR
jgi:tetratricopeptide (TPR) repeat protein